MRGRGTALRKKPELCTTVYPDYYIFGPLWFGPLLCWYFGHVPGVEGWMPMWPDDPGPHQFCPRCEERLKDGKGDIS